VEVNFQFVCGGVVSFWSLTNQTWENEMQDLIKLMNFFLREHALFFGTFKKKTVSRLKPSFEKLLDHTRGSSHFAQLILPTNKQMSCVHMTDTDLTT
jgi:hypothetical protein